MPSSISYSINFLLLSVIAIQLTSSARFSTSPSLPLPPDASLDDWTHFLELLHNCYDTAEPHFSNASQLPPPDPCAHLWELVHNYYTIAARPRFGKRSKTRLTPSKPPSLLEILNPNFAHPSSSDNKIINYLLSEIADNANNDEQMNADDVNAFVHLDRTRR